MKNAIIIGDSYSTFRGYVPEGYLYWYPQGGSAGAETDLKQVEYTWWYRLMEQAEGKIALNNSYSGSTVCATERPGLEGTNFNARVDKLIEQGFFRENAIDTVFVFGGTNDSWINTPIGEVKSEDISDEDMKATIPAFSRLISTLKGVLPEARIIALINSDIKEVIKDGYEQISRTLGITSIRLKSLDLLSGHPSVAGMAQIKDQIIEALTK